MQWFLARSWSRPRDSVRSWCAGLMLESRLLARPARRQTPDWKTASSVFAPPRTLCSRCSPPRSEAPQTEASRDDRVAGVAQCARLQRERTRDAFAHHVEAPRCCLRCGGVAADPVDQQLRGCRGMLERD